MKFCKSFITNACAIAAGALLASSVLAADVYPNKPVTLVVPFAAGGPTDAVARLIAVPMGKELGQSVIVENTVGAGGTIAATRVARSAPELLSNIRLVKPIVNLLLSATRSLPTKVFSLKIWVIPNPASAVSKRGVCA